MGRAVGAGPGLRLLIETVWAHARGPALVWAASYVLGGVLPAVTIALAGAFLDGLATVAGHGAAGLLTVLPAAAGLALAALAQQALYTLWPVCEQLCALRCQRGLDGRLLSGLAATDLATREQPWVDDLLGRAGAPGAAVTDTLQLLLNGVMDAAGAISLGLVLGRAAWWLPLGLCGGVVPLGAARIRAAAARRDLDLDQAADGRLAGHLADLASSRGAAAEVRLLGLPATLIGHWEALARGLARDRTLLALKSGLAAAGPALLPWLLATAAIAVLGALTRSGRLEAGQAVALVAGVVALVRTAGALAERGGSLKAGLDRLADVARLLALPAAEATAGRRAVPGRLRHGIAVQDLAFRHTGQARNTLEGLTLEIRAGEHLALVGPNGGGKSTLARCLLGLYRPAAGRILWDGTDLAAMDSAALSRAIRPVFQDHLRPEFTLGEAIAAGCRHPDPRDLERAAAGAGLLPLLSGLPRAWDTPLGRSLHDDGIEPSGGQWQRIAIARGLFAAPEVLILDEPAAALDPLAEAALYGQFRELGAGRTVLLISHRLGSARLADRIAVLAGGRIVETGSHETLLTAGGLYARMWAAQAAWYAEAGAGAGEAP